MARFDHDSVRVWGKGFEIKATDPREPSHELQDGRGKYHVPMESYPHFLKLLGSNLDNGVVNYLVERRTPIFRMYTRLDVLFSVDDDASIPEAWFCDLQSVMRDMFATVPKFLPRTNDKFTGSQFDRLSMLICRAPPTYDYEKNKKTWTRVQVQLVWPFIYCALDQAQQVRDAFIQCFERKYGRRVPDNPWEDVFHASAYVDPIPMIGSDSIANCPTCKGRKSPDGFCSAGLCDGESGKYAANHIFRVDGALNAVGRNYKKLHKAVLQSGHHQVQFTTIRTARRTMSDMNQPDWLDPYFFKHEDGLKTFNRLTPTERKKRRKLLTTLPENQQAARELRLNDAGSTYHKGHPMVDRLQRWIKDAHLPDNVAIPDIWRNAEIFDVKQFDEGESARYIVRVDSYFCINVGGEHPHANIYFLVTSKGLWQRCCCRCAKKGRSRSGKPCARFCSSPYPLPPDVLQVMYPIQFEKMIELDTICRDNNVDLRELDEERERRVLMIKKEELARRHEFLLQRKKNKLEKQYRSKRG